MACLRVICPSTFRSEPRLCVRACARRFTRMDPFHLALARVHFAPYLAHSFRALSRAGGRSARERGCITALAAHSGGLIRTAPSPIGPPFISSRALSRPLSSPFALIPCTTRARLTFLPCAFRFCVLRCAFHRYPAAGQSSRASGSCARLSPSAAGYLCPSPRALAPRVP